MKIYIFAEHYPNPYKPQFDSEFAYLVRNGHNVRIFVMGQFLSTVHPRVKSFGLDKLTSVHPTTLRDCVSHLPRIVLRVLSNPFRTLRLCRAIIRGRRPGLKKNVLRILMAHTLPDDQPDVCYVHNIATADRFDFLRLLYPYSHHGMYFHGGEVGGVQKVDRAKELFEGMEKVWTNTEFSRRQAIGRGSAPAKTVVLPVGFDLGDYVRDAAREYRPQGIMRIVSIGRIAPEKGLHYSLEAVARIVRSGAFPLRYTIVGRGVEEKAVAELVHQLGLEAHVRLVGEKAKDDVVSLLWESDVLLLPSLETDTWAETQAAVVQEAMFTGVLVVGTNVGGVPESTAESLQRFSVAPGNVDAMVDAISRIAALSLDELLSITDSAREFAQDRFDIDATGAQLVADFREMLGR
jgi:colanic acid/amylovoran biosynthesis glycosyltransferase